MTGQIGYSPQRLLAYRVVRTRLSLSKSSR